MAKIRDYDIDDYVKLAQAQKTKIPEIVESKAFYDKLMRFLPTEVQERTLKRTGFEGFLRDGLTQTLDEAIAALDAPDQVDPEFKM